MSGTIQINYEQSKEVAKRFEQQAEAGLQIAQQLRQSLQTLENAGWEGEGSEAYFAEMNGEMLPALERLRIALEQGGIKMGEIAAIFREAEEAASHALGSDLDGTGSGGPVFPGAPKPGPYAQHLMASVGRMIPRPGSRVGYNGLPYVRGKGLGHSTTISRTIEELKKQFQSIEHEQEELDATRTFFEETMRDEGKDVEVAAKKDLQTNLQELNKKKGRVNELVKAYRQEGRQIVQAEARAAAAENKVNAAIHENKAAQAAVEQFEKRTSRRSLEAQRRDLEKAIAKKTKIMSKLFDFAAATSQGNAADFAKGEATAFVKESLLSAMTDKEVARLAQIDSKIQALDEAIHSAENNEVRNRLSATRDSLEAAFNESVAANLDSRIHKIEQWNALDELAQIERNHGQGTMFQELQDYNSQVRYAAAELRKGSEAYMDSLGRGAVSRASEMAQYVEADIRDVESSVQGGDRAWDMSARTSKGYFESVERWRQGEFRRYRQLRNRLIEGRHLNLIDDTMKKAEEALGGTVKEDQL